MTPPEGIKEALVLLNLGDSVTTDHISPAGSIARNSPAARYLGNRGYVSRGAGVSVKTFMFVSIAEQYAFLSESNCLHDAVTKKHDLMN